MLIDCTNIHIVQGGHHFLRQPYILILIAHLYAVLLITYRGNIGQVLCFAGTDGYAFSTFSIYQVLPKIIELWGLNVQTDVESKKLHATDRPMTTPLFLLRCVQLGIFIRDLDLLTIGMVNDMYAESSNDEYKGYAQIATQMDFDAF